MPVSWGYISRDSDSVGPNAAQLLVFYKTYPSDSWPIHWHEEHGLWNQATLI